MEAQPIVRAVQDLTPLIQSVSCKGLGGKGVTSPRHTSKQVYDALAAWIQANGYPPTVREMCGVTDMASTAMGFYWLNKLERDGLLTWPVSSLGRRRARTMKLNLWREAT